MYIYIYIYHRIGPLSLDTYKIRDEIVSLYYYLSVQRGFKTRQPFRTGYCERKTKYKNNNSNTRRRATTNTFCPHFDCKLQIIHFRWLLCIVLKHFHLPIRNIRWTPKVVLIKIRRRSNGEIQNRRSL